MTTPERAKEHIGPQFMRALLEKPPHACFPSMKIMYRMRRMAISQYEIYVRCARKVYTATANGAP